MPPARLPCFRLNDDKATPGGAVKVGAESAMHFNFDGPARVCYLFISNYRRGHFLNCFFTDTFNISLSFLISSLYFINAL